MTENQKERISVEIIKTLYTQFQKFPGEEINNRNAPFHEAFLNAFSNKLTGKVESIPVLISLASWIHGLNTSLGQSFLEKTAHILSNGTKKMFTNVSHNILKISSNQKVNINNLLTKLTNGEIIPNLCNENNIWTEDTNLDIDATEFTADVFIEDENQIVCIEIKTVKPNKGIFRVEKEKILEAKIALKNKYANKNISYLLGFPFDPLDETSTGYNKSRFMDYSVGFKKYFSEDEFLLSSELWNFLSGESNTMEEIINIINTISTPSFMEKFNFINEFSNIDVNKNHYINTLREWFLFSNVKISENVAILKEKLVKDRRYQRYLYQSLFNNNINYRTDRVTELLTLL